jgi:hypothetical protein
VPISTAPDGAVFLFMGRYAPNVEAVAARYPDGRVDERHDARTGALVFRAYYLNEEQLRRYAARDSITFPLAR